MGNGKRFVLVHAVKCIFATLAKSVFNSLAFTFLNSANTKGDATNCTNLNSTCTRMLCVQKLRILFIQFREKDV